MVDAKLFQIMVEQVKDYAVFLLDPEGHVLSWNLGAQKIKGYAASEIIGRHFSAFYPPDLVRNGWPDRELEMATREGRFEDEGFRVRKDGSFFWANVVITALRDEDGKLLAFSKITRDLSERRRQEEMMRQSEERSRLLLEGVRDYAIYMLDPEGIVSSWNSGAERIHGYSRDEIVGKNFSNLYPPEDIKAGLPWNELRVARQKGRVENEGWRLRKGGERFWARVTVTPLYDSAGSLRGFANLMQDLTQKQHVQELESAASRVNEFIAVLAHELRNPLAPIRTALEIMEHSASDDPVQTKMRQMIGRQAKRLTRVVNDMVDISRVTGGTLAIDKKPVEVSQLIERAVELATPSINTGRHRLELDLSAGKLAVEGDAHRLCQVISNLLDNAARYTPPGGSISVRAWLEGKQVAISVRDNGRGIASDSMQSIFQMFVRGRAPVDRYGEGLGVGLAMSRGIVELHGGTLQVKSEGEGKGSEFIVRLPATTKSVLDESQAPEPALTAVNALAVARRVLVVEDNVDVALSLNMLLQMLGHTTHVAHHGNDALLAFDEFRPDIVLLDLGLPGIDGYEVARRMRARRTKGLRIIAITGWGQPEDRERSAAAGFDLHLVKPIDEQQLQTALAPSGSSLFVH